MLLMRPRARYWRQYGGALLRGVKREQMKRGQVIIAPGSMKPVTKFQAQIYVSTGTMDRFRQPQFTYRAGANKG